MNAIHHKHPLLASARERLSDWSFRFLGPTTVHLRFEFCLLLSLLLLTYSSLQGLYKENFGLAGDYVYLSLLFLCLSRHLVLRILITWDASTHASPTVLGLLSHFITAHLTAGQVHDRASASVLSRLVGNNPSADGSGVLSFAALLPSSAVYAWELFQQKIWHPATLRTDNASNRRYSRCSDKEAENGILLFFGFNEAHDWLQRTTHTVKRKAQELWNQHGPSLHFLFPVTVTLLLILGLGFYHRRYFPFSVFAQGGIEDVAIEWNLITMDSRSRNAMKQAPEGANMPAGAYQAMTEPSWLQVFFEMVTVGQLLSLVCFLRVVLPLPDLVAGGNVVKDVRQDSHTPRPSSRTSRASKESSMQLSQYQLPQEAPWPERVRHISTAHRLRLHIFIILVRLAENVFLCVLLPRTLYICRATKHCPTSLPLWALSRVIFPAGISNPHRKDGVRSFALMEQDSPSAIWTAVCVVSVTITLLTAHALVTNKAYIATLGLLADEWKPVDLTNEGRDASSSTAVPWDSRKKYKKGDLVLFTSAGKKVSVFEATENNPEGKPTDLAAFYSSLQSELGHPATSQFLYSIACDQSVVIASLVFMWLSLTVLGYSVHGMFPALVANMIALHAILSVGTGHYSSLEALNHEIRQAAS